MKKKVGDKLCLIGNIDVAHDLTYGTKEEVFKHAIKTAGPGGGYIVSPANMHPTVKVDNLRWMVEATKKFGDYPISQK
ncbi:MAG: uroporphyrinogen decarboxylase family protein [Promethearchaeota archaeon]